MRPIIFLILISNCAAASAAVTCEQLAGIAVTAQRLRDQGGTLASVLAEADKLKADDKFTAREIDRIKDVAETAYGSGSRMPLDLMKECKQKLAR